MCGQVGKRATGLSSRTEVQILVWGDREKRIALFLIELLLTLELQT
jgi:hypothetical protein